MLVVVVQVVIQLQALEDLAEAVMVQREALLVEETQLLTLVEVEAVVEA
jgi:hypothetical protein